MDENVVKEIKETKEKLAKKLAKPPKGGSKMLHLLFLVMAVSGLALILVLPSIRIIEEGTIGVVRRFGQAVDIIPPGLHFAFWVTQDVVRLDGRVQSLDIAFAAHTNDAQPINGGITVHYQVITADAVNIIAEFGNMVNLYNRLLPVFLSEAQNVLATKSAMELVENRAILAMEIQTRLGEIAPQYRIIINHVVLEQLLFSPAFDVAVEARMVAEQEMMMAELERERAIIQADQYLEVQRLRNQAIIDQAISDAQALEIMQEAWGELGMEVREAMLRQMFFETWNGVLPQVLTDSNLSIIMDGLGNTLTNPEPTNPTQPTTPAETP